MSDIRRIQCHVRSRAVKNKKNYKGNKKIPKFCHKKCQVSLHVSLVTA